MLRFRYIYGEKEDVILGKSSALACIVPNQDGKTWRLVRLDDEAEIEVNSEPLHLVHYLTPGDRIEMEGETLRFGVRDDMSGHEFGKAYRRFRRTSVISASVAAIIALLVLALTVDLYRKREIRRDELAVFESSVCKISVVSIIYQEVEVGTDSSRIKTLGTMSLNSLGGSGTGFFCDDGRFLTARHCVEPWITEEDPLAENASKAAGWAAEAETFNICGSPSDSIYRRLVSVCEIYRGKDVIRFRSDSCLFSTGNDLVRNLRGRLDPMYWRELGNVNRMSALGDIAAVQTGIKGEIAVADKELLNSLEAERQMGHLGYENSSTSLSFMTSTLKYNPEMNGSRIVRCLEHESIEMLHGFSGSPAIVRKGRRHYAVGIVSKTHDNSSSTFFSVPVSELENLKRRWTE